MELEGSVPHSQVPATCPYPFFLDGHTVVAVSSLTLLKSLNIQFPILFLSCFPLTASQKCYIHCWF